MNAQEHKEDATRTAIEFLMLWMSDDREGAAAHINGVVHGENAPDPMYVIAGLLNLNMISVFDMAQSQGATDHRAWAQEYLQQRSLRLPQEP